MYKITNVTDKQGIVKQDFIDLMKSRHGDDLLGDFIYYDYIKLNIDSNPCCQFKWGDDSGHMMLTSRVQQIDENYDRSVICIVTENSIYTFKKS